MKYFLALYNISLKSKIIFGAVGGDRTRINWFWRPATFRLAHHCMVRAEGIEPSTFRLWADYSNHWVIPASSHNESDGGKDLPRYRKLSPLILVIWSHKHSYSHLAYWDWFWPLQAGTQLFAYIVPILHGIVLQFG